jgi:S1-C subfamily serine protease
MGRLLTFVLQIAVAALAGYWAGQHAVQSAAPAAPPILAPVPAAPPILAPVPAAPGTGSQASAPPAVSSASTAPPAAVSPAAAPAASLSNSYRTAVEQAAQSVVTVYSARTAAVGPLGLGGRRLISQGLGSGVVVNGNGHIVTNNHVVENATELAVALPNGTVAPAKLLGVDPETDLALLSVDAPNLQPITIADIRTVAVGDVVLAVGNPLGVGPTVTQGIVSALGRKGIGINTIENFIQTDAAINPGNSGGALIDTAGRLIGINSAILSRGGGSEGIGFAIPVDLAQRVVASLEKNGRVARGWLGISTQAAAPGQPGVLVASVQRGGPADRAGLASGDLMVRLGERTLGEPEDVLAATLEYEAGTRVPVEVVREGRRQTLTIELGRRPVARAPAQRGG